MNLSGVDRQAVSEVTSLKHHAKPAITGAAKTRHSELSNLHSAVAVSAINLSSATVYPGDLSFHGGKMVEYAESHPIYLFSTSAKCTTISCWGNPATFLQNLAASQLIHIVDQYTNNSAPNRYTLGSSFHHSIGPSSKTAPLTDKDMAAYAHAAAKSSGSGYGHIYHIFLPPGQDVCFSATGGVCYSPDNPATFSFCAYHGSADFSDVGHVLYTVEPFQNVSGCRLQPGTPNGELIDSTVSVLSHETVETITDPDGTGWWNSTDDALDGQEIADECSYILASTGSFDAPSFAIGAKHYAVQREYDNTRHACTEAP